MNKFIIIPLLIVAISGCKPEKARYFEYGVNFTLNSGCKSGAQGTITLDHPVSYDDIKNNIAKWVYPEKIKTINVWYLNEVTKGEMYVFDEPFNCAGLHSYEGDKEKQIKILNQKSNKY